MATASPQPIADLEKYIKSVTAQPPIYLSDALFGYSASDPSNEKRLSQQATVKWYAWLDTLCTSTFTASNLADIEKEIRAGAPLLASGVARGFDTITGWPQKPFPVTFIKDDHAVAKAAANVAGTAGKIFSDAAKAATAAAATDAATAKAAAATAATKAAVAFCSAATAFGDFATAVSPTVSATVSPTVSAAVSAAVSAVAAFVTAANDLTDTNVDAAKTAATAFSTAVGSSSSSTTFSGVFGDTVTTSKIDHIEPSQAALKLYSIGYIWRAAFVTKTPPPYMPDNSTLAEMVPNHGCVSRTDYHIQFLKSVIFLSLQPQEAAFHGRLAAFQQLFFAYILGKNAAELGTLFAAFRNTVSANARFAMPAVHRSPYYTATPPLPTDLWLSVRDVFHVTMRAAALTSLVPSGTKRIHVVDTGRQESTLRGFVAALSYYYTFNKHDATIDADLLYRWILTKAAEAIGNAANINSKTIGELIQQSANSAVSPFLTMLATHLRLTLVAIDVQTAQVYIGLFTPDMTYAQGCSSTLVEDNLGWLMEPFYKYDTFVFGYSPTNVFQLALELPVDYTTANNIWLTHMFLFHEPLHAFRQTVVVPYLLFHHVPLSDADVALLRRVVMDPNDNLQQWFVDGDHLTNYNVLYMYFQKFQFLANTMLGDYDPKATIRIIADIRDEQSRSVDLSVFAPDTTATKNFQQRVLLGMYTNSHALRAQFVWPLLSPSEATTAIQAIRQLAKTGNSIETNAVDKILQAMLTAENPPPDSAAMTRVMRQIDASMSASIQNNYRWLYKLRFTFSTQTKNLYQHIVSSTYTPDDAWILQPLTYVETIYVYTKLDAPQPERVNVSVFTDSLPGTSETYQALVTAGMRGENQALRTQFIWPKLDAVSDVTTAIWTNTFSRGSTTLTIEQKNHRTVLTTILNMILTTPNPPSTELDMEKAIRDALGTVTLTATSSASATTLGATATTFGDVTLANYYWLYKLRFTFTQKTQILYQHIVDNTIDASDNWCLAITPPA